MLLSGAFYVFFIVIHVSSSSVDKIPKFLQEESIEIKQRRGATAKDEVCPLSVSPCSCAPTSDGTQANIDCSSVKNELELFGVFSNNVFPKPNLRYFNIENNFHVTSLTRNVFGDVTFEYFRIHTSLINRIESQVFDNFDFTLKSIEVSSTELKDDTFPFTKLPDLHYLTSLYLVSNLLSTFPTLTSNTLQLIDFAQNSIASFSSNTFDSTPDVTTIVLGNNNIVTLPPNTFNNLIYVKTIDLSANGIEVIPSFAFVVSPVTSQIYLNYNGISFVDPNAVQGFSNGLLDLGNNQIASFSETSFKSILQSNNNIDIHNNPLDCGCEIAWVMNDSSFFDLISEYDPTCKNGTLLEDLDPDFFLEC